MHSTSRKSAGFDLVFEIADVDSGEVLAHDSDCFAPILRSSAGWSSVSIMRPAKARAMSSPSDCVGHLGSRKAWGSLANVDLVAFHAFAFAASGLRPKRLGFLARLQIRIVPAVVEVLRGNLAKEETHHPAWSRARDESV